MRCEIRDITLPDKVIEDMQRQVSSTGWKSGGPSAFSPASVAKMHPIIHHISAFCPYVLLSQVSAERKKRAAILESEGSRESAINEAEGRKRAVILASEARRLEQANNALGEAEAIRARAEATAHAINLTAKAIGQAVSGPGGGGGRGGT